MKLRKLSWLSAPVCVRKIVHVCIKECGIYIVYTSIRSLQLQVIAGWRAGDRAFIPKKALLLRTLWKLPGTRDGTKKALAAATIYLLLARGE